MQQVDLYIYGAIYQDARPGSGLVSLASLVEDYRRQGGAAADSVAVHIHSNGGDVDEGFAIYDWLRSLGKPITTIIEGVCRSIATVVALAGDTRQMTSHSEFRIHNPWGVASGTADELQDYAEQVKAYEERLKNFYSKRTGTDVRIIASLMDADEAITAERAKELGFITEIVNTIKAVALFHNKNQNNMSNILNSINKKFDLLMKAIKGEEVKNLMLTTADGVEVEVQTEEARPAVGDIVMINGEPAAAGDYVLADGTTITIGEGGKIIAITAAAPADVTALARKLDAIIKALDDHRSAIDQKLAAVESQTAVHDKALADIADKFQTLASAVRSTYKVKDREPIFAKRDTEEQDRVASIRDKVQHLKYNYSTGSFNMG